MATIDPRLTVFVDMDGVLAGFDAGALSAVANLDPSFRLNPVRSNFYVAQDYPSHKEAFRIAYTTAGFFRSLATIDGAIEGWRRILDAGYQPRVLSSPLRVNPTCEAEKREWLEEHFGPKFGPSVAHDAIITSDKYLHDGIALIDDRPILPRTDEASWSHILMHYSYNESIDTDLRLQGWNDPNLERLLAVAEQRYTARTSGQVWSTGAPHVGGRTQLE